MRLRLKQLFEQAAKLVPWLKPTETWIAHMQANAMDYPKIADIDEYDLHRGANEPHIFGISLAGVFVAIFDLNILSRSEATLQSVYVNPQQRGKRLTEKFLWFVKSNLGIRRIITDYRHSEAMRGVFSSLDGFFKVKWLNKATGETEAYNPAGPEHYYDGDRQDDRENWTILIESYYQRKPMPSVSETRSWQPPEPIPNAENIYECLFPERHSHEA